MDEKIPINVIVIEDFENDIDSLVDGYLEILDTCKKIRGKRAAVKMIVEESMSVNTKTIFTRLVQHLAELQAKKD